MSAADTPPYAPGELVMINGFTHLGLQRVDRCEWGAPPNFGPACWMCECSAAGAEAAAATASPPWRGPAAYLSRHTDG